MMDLNKRNFWIAVGILLTIIVIIFVAEELM